jgi:acyl-CoA thioesterase
MATDRQTEVDFDARTALSDAGPPWSVQLHPSLAAMSGNMHAGHVAAIVLRALEQVVDDPARAPRTLTLQLPAAIAAGAVAVDARVTRTGGSMSWAAADVEQAGELVATALASFGRERPSPEHHGLTMPAVPTAQDCPPLFEGTATSGMRVVDTCEFRTVTPFATLASGRGPAEVLLWMRMVEDRPVDALSATMLADLCPPSIFPALSEPRAVPTTEMSVHLADVAAAARDPWLLGRFRTGHVADGYVIEDGELWTPDGALVLVTRQLRRLLSLPAPGSR